MHALRTQWPTVGRNLHRARVGAFYALSALLTLFLTFELFAHFLAPTPVVTDWAHGHHVHSIAHAVLTAVLIAAVAVGVHPRTRRIAGLQGLLLVTVVGFLVSVFAWQGIHNLAFPVFNFTLYGSIALIVAALHPERSQLFAPGRIEPGLLAMAVLAFLPLLAFAAVEVSKQLSNAEPAHAVVGHFALMGALAVALAAVAGLAALRTEGCFSHFGPRVLLSPPSASPRSPFRRRLPASASWVGSWRSGGEQSSSGSGTGE